MTNELEKHCVDYHLHFRHDRTKSYSENYWAEFISKSAQAHFTLNGNEAAGGNGPPVFVNVGSEGHERMLVLVKDRKRKQQTSVQLPDASLWHKAVGPSNSTHRNVCTPRQRIDYEEVAKRTRNR